MAYLDCGRCGLEIKIQATYLKMANCPRCLARSATVTPMTLRPHGVIAAGGRATPRPDHRSDPPEPGESCARPRHPDRHHGV